MLMIAGLGDPAEAWTFRLDHPATGELTVTSMADDAIEVMGA